MFRSTCVFEITLKFETRVNPKCKKQIKGHSGESGVCVCVCVFVWVWVGERVMMCVGGVEALANTFKDPFQIYLKF